MKKRSGISYVLGAILILVIMAIILSGPAFHGIFKQGLLYPFILMSFVSIQDIKGAYCRRQGSDFRYAGRFNCRILLYYRYFDRKELVC